MIAKKIIVSGKVQGVFYRRFVYNNTTRLGLKGYVKNLDNGSVEIVIQGEIDKINELIKECEKGPERAEVEDIKVNKIETHDFKGFEIK